MPVYDRQYFKDGSYLDESANPYEQGTDAYYWFRRQRRNAAEGRVPGALPGAVKTGKIDKPDEWYASEIAAERALDTQRGQVPTGYQELIDPTSGKTYYQQANPNPTPGNYYSRGKAGGAGNTAPGLSPDNNWNLADGTDIRTDEQKFYDRDLSAFHQSADAEGKYSWYATEANYDPTRPKETRQVNLDQFAAAKPQTQYGGWEQLYKGVDSNGGTPVDTSYNPDAYSRSNYANYNKAPDAGFFDQAIRSRDNKSLAARTGMGGYR